MNEENQKVKIFECDGIVYLEKNYDDPEIKAMWDECEEINALCKSLEKNRKKSVLIADLIYWTFVISVFCFFSCLVNFERSGMISIACGIFSGIFIGHFLTWIFKFYKKSKSR